MIQLLLLVLSASPNPALGASVDDVRADWLQEDLQRARDLFDFASQSGLRDGGPWVVPVEKRGVVSVESRDLGYGAVLHRIDWIGGYTHHQAEVLDFEGLVVEYRLSVQGSVESWPLVRRQVTAASSELAVDSFEPEGTGLAKRRRFEPVALAFRH